MFEVTENAEVNVIYDHYYFGGANSRGEIKQVWGKEALDNTLKMWLASLSGEIIRSPERAGYLRYWLTKPMTEVQVDDLYMTIRDGFSHDFVPHMKIIDLSITPNLEKRRWNIYLKVYSPDLKIMTEISEEIKARV